MFPRTPQAIAQFFKAYVYRAGNIWFVTGERPTWVDGHWRENGLIDATIFGHNVLFIGSDEESLHCYIEGLAV